MTVDLWNAVDERDIRFLIEKNADGIIVVDAEGVVLFANPAAEQIFGRRAETLIGTHIGIPLSSGETTEISVLKPHDGQVEVEVRCVDTAWNRGTARLASLRDVSARKAQEERLRHATKMEAVGRLTAGIAHDFNNLLTVVLGNLDSAQRLLGSADSAVQRSIDNAIHGARRAAVLTERLLAFARRKPLEPCVLDVNVLVEGMSDLLRRTLGETIQVRTSLMDDLWNVDADPTELETTLLNLAVNARDAMPEGGTLAVATMNVNLDAAAAHAGDVEPGRYVLIRVADTGMGMSPETLKLAFEPFFSTKSSRGGTGLGLSQVYGFVRQSGGCVKLDSEPGRGTTVDIYLPAVELGRSLMGRESFDTRADSIPRGTRDDVILVVEDHDDVRRYAVASLTGLGYAVIEARDAKSALDIIEREPHIDLMFTDLGLPGGVDGKALAEQARQRRPRLPVLITSGYAGDVLIENGRLDANFELLSKPFTLPALAKRIHELLARGKQETTSVTGACVLVVEDEPLVRMYLTDILDDGGCRAEEAGTFKEALARLHASGDRLAAAIVDITLPDRSGVDVVSELRRLRPELPIVVVTGHAVDDLRLHFARDARVKILSKPFNRASLIETLRGFGVPYRPPGG